MERPPVADPMDERGTEMLDESPRCTAKSKQSGQRCRKAPMKGQSVCLAHGGGAPQNKHAAARRQVEAQALSTFGGGTAPVRDPLEALAQLAGEILAVKDFL